MYAVLRQYRYDAAKLAGAERALSDAQALHAAQPGYVGSFVVDDGERLTAVNLWATEQAAAAGRTAIGEQVQRLLEPLMAGPSEVIAVGEVVAGDLGRSRPAESGRHLGKEQP